MSSAISAPSQPLKPRGFVTFRRMPLTVDYNVDLELHWWRPQFPNGRLVNYSVMYEKSDSIGIWRRESIIPEQLSFNLSEVLKNHIYKLKVSTEFGSVEFRYTFFCSGVSIPICYLHNNRA